MERVVLVGNCAWTTKSRSRRLGRFAFWKKNLCRFVVFCVMKLMLISVDCGWCLLMSFMVLCVCLVVGFDYSVFEFSVVDSYSRVRRYGFCYICVCLMYVCVVIVNRLCV